MVDAALIAQYVANGVIFGGILSLAAIGLSLVYGILNLSNFAHGDFVTLGAFVAYFFAVGDVGARGAPEAFYRDAAPIAGLVVALVLLAVAALDRFTKRRMGPGETAVLAGFALALGALATWLLFTGPGGPGTTNRVLALATLISVAAVVALTLALELLVWRPLRKRGATTLTLIICSIGVALFVRNALLLRFGGHNRALQRPVPEAPRYFDIAVSEAQQFALLVTVVVIVLVHLLLTRTRVGKAMRAVRDNADLARVSGINVDRVVVHVWVLGATLTALSGVLLVLVNNNSMNVGMGFNILLPLFSAVILGGVGSAYGAMAGGFVVGVAMKTSVLWLGTKYETASAFLILIGVLLVRPQGIFGLKV